jgi:uncharacterized protein (TIGR02246 family)
MGNLREWMAAVVLVLAIGGVDPAVAADKLRQAIDTGNGTFLTAYQAGDAAKLASVYAKDAAVLPPGADRMNGRDAVQKFWQGAMDAGIRNVTLKTLEVEARGNLAYETGEFGLDAPTKDGKLVHTTGKYMVVWKRTGDGKWQIFRDIWNETPAH